jgi:TatD DNase family protein
MLFDSHCHVQFNAYKDDADTVIKKCQAKCMILNCVGSQIDTSRRAVEYAEKYDNVYATVGMHPIHLFTTDVDEEEISFKSRGEEFNYEAYKKLAMHPKTIAIGECGLELYHLPADVDKAEVLAKQKEGLSQQIKLANELKLPLVIHVRDAYDEMINFLNLELGTWNLEFPSGVVHCYGGNWEQAKKFLDIGLYIGFTGVITFPARKTNPKPTEDLLEVVKNCPLDRMLIETDAPYLAPQAYRGERCEPWMVEEVAKKIGEIRGVPTEEIIEITSANAIKLFKIRN